MKALMTSHMRNNRLDKIAQKVKRYGIENFLSEEGLIVNIDITTAWLDNFETDTLIEKKYFPIERTT